MSTPDDPDAAGEHRSAGSRPRADAPDDRVDGGPVPAFSADEGEPDIEPFAQPAEPDHDPDHGYGYE